MNINESTPINDTKDYQAVISSLESRISALEKDHEQLLIRVQSLDAALMALADYFPVKMFHSENP